MKPNRVVVRPTGMNDLYAKHLAEALSCERVISTGYTPHPKDVVISFGASYEPLWDSRIPIFINKMEAIKKAVDKVLAFSYFQAKGVSTPEWTQDSETAKDWLKLGHTVLSRTKKKGFDGAGIAVCNKGDKLPPAPLYTKYIHIDNEFRVNVFDGKVIDVYERKMKNGVKHNPLIRTTGGGWVFTRDPYWVPADAKRQAIKAISALGLDFGGVDVIYNEKTNRSYVLEVNTAPLIYKETPGRLAKAIKEYIETL